MSDLLGGGSFESLPHDLIVYIARNPAREGFQLFYKDDYDSLRLVCKFLYGKLAKKKGIHIPSPYPFQKYPTHTRLIIPDRKHEIGPFLLRLTGPYNGYMDYSWSLNTYWCKMDGYTKIPLEYRIHKYIDHRGCACITRHLPEPMSQLSEEEILGRSKYHKRKCHKLHHRNRLHIQNIVAL